MPVRSMLAGLNSGGGCSGYAPELTAFLRLGHHLLAQVFGVFISGVDSLLPRRVGAPGIALVVQQVSELVQGVQRWDRFLLQFMASSLLANAADRGVLSAVS